MAHLKPEQLVAYRDGELRDEAALAHVRECESCRRTLGSARMLAATLASSGTRAGSRNHPDDAELAAFVDEALSSRRMARVQRHLRSCEGCLASVLALRTSTAPRKLLAMPAPLSAQMRERLRRASQRKSLGSVLIERYGACGARLIPQMIAYENRMQEPLTMYEAPASAYHPASARARQARLSEPIVASFVTSRPGIAAPAAAAAAAADASLADSANLQLGALHLLLSVHQQHGDIVLKTHIVDLESVQPVREVELVLTARGGASHRASPDPSGRVQFKLDDLPATLLIVVGDREWELSIAFVAGTKRCRSV